MPVTFNATKQEINKNGLIQIIKRKVNSDYIKTQLQNYSDCEILDHRIDTLNIIEQSDIEISNNFVMAVHLAYAEHLPLTISPDMIWLLIAQGIARHCSINTEEARKFFVNHDGKKKLVVRRDDFTLHGSNPWHEVFDDFSLQIQTNIGETRSKDLMPVFSTTKELEQTCFHLALMDIMKNYFSYELHTLCDLTEITLEGEKADWVLLLEHVTLLSNYGLDWWVKYLAPALQPFIDAFDGKIDTEYWTEFYKRRGGSGGPFVSGHILKFFPYIEKRRNSYLDSNWGCPVSDIPNGLAVIPMKWIYFDKEFEMSLFSGFLGIGIKEESLRPSMGWAVGNTYG